MRRKNIADIMLLASFAVFVLAFLAHKSQPHNFAVGLVYMISEAALVGGVADWFAVTALFRRPLGFPWHTALVPKNRERIVASLAGAVENEFLSVETLKQHLERVRLTGLLIQWINTFGGERIIVGALSAVQQTLQEQDALVWAAKLEEYLRSQVKTRDPLPMLRQGIRLLLASEKTAQVADQLLEKAQNMAASLEFRQRLEQKLSDYQRRDDLNWLERAIFWLGERTDAVNTADAAAVLQNELVGVLNDLRALDHPLRQWLVEQLNDFSTPQPTGGDAWRQWREELADGLHLAKLSETVFEGARQAAVQSLLIPESTDVAADSMLRIWLVRQLTDFWVRFCSDIPLQDWVEDRLRLVIYHVIETEHHLIGDVVRSALAQLDDDALNDFILSRAGNDLQWIRINGSLVGGVVGALVYLFLQLLYQPHILPLLPNLR